MRTINSIRFFRLFTLLCASILASLSLEAQLLYRISGNGLDQPSYIFGTHHLAPASMPDSINGLKDAFNEAECIIGELDMTQPQITLALSMQPYMTAPADSTLTKLFSPEKFALLNDKFKTINSMPGIDLYALDNLKPIAVCNFITLALFQNTMPGYDPSFQIDSFLQQEGKSAGKKIMAFETPEEQANLLFNFQPLTAQAKSLEEMLEDPDNVVELALQLNQAYLSQNLDELYQLSLKENSQPEFMEALIDKRNNAWIPSIVNTIATTPTLIVCGALHLPGEDGIINLLKNNGFDVIPIQ